MLPTWDIKRGEALTTNASLTMGLVLQLLGRHLHDWYVPMCELVDEFSPARAGDLGRLRLGKLAARIPEKRRRNTHLSYKLVGDNLSAESAPSGTSKVTVGIGAGLSSISMPTSCCCRQTGWSRTLKRGAEAPR